jgi:hypothetical protein
MSRWSAPRPTPAVDLDAVRSKVKAQGEKIRIMKRDGAAPADITAEVATLTVLKEELKKAAEAVEVRFRRTDSLVGV